LWPALSPVHASDVCFRGAERTSADQPAALPLESKGFGSRPFVAAPASDVVSVSNTKPDEEAIDLDDLEESRQSEREVIGVDRSGWLRVRTTRMTVRPEGANYQ
jgi:hypothetical protein